MEITLKDINKEIKQYRIERREKEKKRMLDGDCEFYAVLDTNIIVSFLLSKNPNSPIVFLLNKLEGKALIPIYSNEMMKEYLEVLPRDKFNFSKAQIDYVINLILDNGIIIKPNHLVEENFNDVDDIPFYEAVVQANEILKDRDLDCYLVTRNIKDFPKKDFIITAREMMEVMLKKTKEIDKGKGK